MDQRGFLRRTRDARRAAKAPPPLLTLRGADEVAVVFGIDSLNLSSRRALLEPLAQLDAARVATLSAPEVDRELPGCHSANRPVAGPEELASAHATMAVAVSTGHHLGAGATVDAAARAVGARRVVVQHGLLTPLAPPLPPDCTLLAWSEADGEFWRSGRDDVEVIVVGSQLLWCAAHRHLERADGLDGAVGVGGRDVAEDRSGAAGRDVAEDRSGAGGRDVADGDVGADGPPVFLGQLHGAEIPRATMAAVSASFCRDHDARYRPHPSEIDKRSRLTHARWKRQGIRFERSGRPLDELANPVVGVFSTGILEAAAAGRPAWAYHPNPPEWVRELWERYGMAQWGSGPTPPPARPDREPATVIADLIATWSSS